MTTAVVISGCIVAIPLMMLAMVVADEFLSRVAQLMLIVCAYPSFHYTRFGFWAAHAWTSWSEGEEVICKEADRSDSGSHCRGTSTQVSVTGPCSLQSGSNSGTATRPILPKLR